MTPRVILASAVSHGCAFGAVEVSAGTDYFVGEVFGHLVFGEHPVAVHGVEVELGRIDHEVVIEVLRVGQRVQQPPPAVERDLRLATVSDPRPRFGLLRGQLHRDAMLRSYLGPGPGRGDDAVIVPAGEVHPGADLVRPGLDLRDGRPPRRATARLAGGLGR